MIKGRDSIPGQRRDGGEAIDDQYRRYRDKTENQEKVRVISEDFIDDIIRKRNRMGLRNGSANESI